MFPVIFRIGPFTLHTFGVMLAIAILVGSTVLLREMRRLGDPKITDERMQRLIWIVVVSVVGGGRLMDVIVRWDYFSQHLSEIPAIWKGGLVMYGGLLAVFFSVVGFAWYHKLNILRLCDLLAPSCFLGDSIGRWGCFFAGDDYGRRTDSWIGIRFPKNPDNLVPPNLQGEKLYPTQIMMSLKAITIFAILMLITRKKKFDGQVAGAALMLYPIFRSFIELFRGDEDRGFVGPLSTAQFTSVFVFATGLLIYWSAPRRLLADELAAEKAAAAPEPPKKKGKKRKTAAA
jgi:phosphatidylglycerol:prolipoprotein diacylglycerol transferase